LAAHSGKKHNWKQIMWEKMIGSTFWEKTYLAANSGGKDE
jgi:hypothetical protein